jgi:hypothetical protein
MYRLIVSILSDRCLFWVCFQSVFNLSHSVLIYENDDTKPKTGNNQVTGLTVKGDDGDTSG